jgi:hypothetical protein
MENRAWRKEQENVNRPRLNRRRDTLHATFPYPYLRFNAKHLVVNLFHQYLHEMVKMSPLQSYVFDVVPSSDINGVIGAAVSAAQNAAA